MNISKCRYMNIKNKLQSSVLEAVGLHEETQIMRNMGHIIQFLLLVICTHTSYPDDLTISSV